MSEKKSLVERGYSAFRRIWDWSMSVTVNGMRMYVAGYKAAQKDAARRRKSNPPQPEPVVIPPMAPYAPYPVPVVPQRMPDVVIYGCQPTYTDCTTDNIKWYGEEADNDD
jgi:hypothetical protein